ncbi:SMP-30/gluconolactonase/LRE family protein [Comamonas endophytica]|uniref:SMP-30/gluconolactonase/LRE family protein n=1 Tax=Comamonas endophytica TaxID=2949090 RepID=A0ABY6GDE3_9BURK|nr:MULTISPECIES: SMP-30/gluconolactonase/LRE family protein [unclassified Acidovorax]MCD2512522.1 SMP-30/gluconolactonase/LRE family protein [Acidovorax sp. D4N7]UYG53112.1 SMP-30/gluconolactonase/LRE family protein [Acidovorax sp. 5MLIR]
MTVRIQEIAAGLRFPEGPIAMPDGSLLLVEIEGRTLTRVGTDGRVERIVQLQGGPNGAALGPDGKVYICNNGGFKWHDSAEHGIRPIGQADDYTGGWIETVDLASGRVERLYERSESGPLRGPNDLVFDRQGGFWFTDHGKTRARDVDRGSVYYARADGSSIREIIFPLWSPNGIGLSADERTLYVAETFTGRIWAFELSAPGEIKPQPWPHSPQGGRLVAGLPGYQNLDSLALDSAGNICVATLSNGGITVVSPCGAHIEHIPMPDAMTTNLCFGGPSLQTAFITLSSTGRLVAMEWERPGLGLNFLNV